MSAHVTGILNVNKPPGMTSRRAVDLVARRVKPAKVGHAGTLDPLATGVLVVCVGKATRLIQFIQQMRKQYRATFLLGRSSPTEDVEGDVIELADPIIPHAHDVRGALLRFRGQMQQRPPVYSALKVDGHRAYDLARRGQTVALKPRPVTVYRLDLVELSYPRLVLDIECSAGTYVRSLGRDLAESLGTAAVMSALVRTQIGPFHIDDAIDPRNVTDDQLPGAIQPPQAALTGLPRVVLDEREIQLLCHGREILRRELAEPFAVGTLAVALDQSGTVLGVLKSKTDGLLHPHINFIGK